MGQIAVLLATYNGSTYVYEFLESLRKQTFQDFHCYIHDDGSSDDTMELLKGYCNTYPEHFSILDGPRCGSAKANFIWMMRAVEADYYMFADQDDVWLTDKIQKSFLALQEVESRSGGVACVFTDMKVVNKELGEIAPSFIRFIGRSVEDISVSRVLVDNPAAGCTQIFNRTLRDKAVLLDDIEKIEMHDAFVLALAAAYGEECVSAIDEPLVLYRQHGNNEMGAVSEGFLQKIWRNMASILSGQAFAEKRAFVQRARDLAAELAKIPEIPQETQSFLQAFSRIGERGKLERIRFYRTHNIMRHKHTIWMYVWI